MKILLPVRLVAEPNAKIRAKPDGSGVELLNIKQQGHLADPLEALPELRIGS
ncbi:hypothetical protein [Rhizobium sp. A37_96]